MARTVKKEWEGSYDDEIKSLLHDQPEDACTLQVVGLCDYVQPGVFQEQFKLYALQKGTAGSGPPGRSSPGSRR